MNEATQDPEDAKTNAVEKDTQGPMQLFATAGEDHVLFVHLDQFGGVADAVSAGRAGRTDRVAQALDAKSRRQGR